MAISKILTIVVAVVFTLLFVIANTSAQENNLIDVAGGRDITDSIIKRDFFVYKAFDGNFQNFSKNIEFTEVIDCKTMTPETICEIIEMDKIKVSWQINKNDKLFFSENVEVLTFHQNFVATAIVLKSQYLNIAKDLKIPKSLRFIPFFQKYEASKYFFTYEDNKISGVRPLGWLALIS